MLFNKPLAEINESDLRVLIDDKVAERKTIEYKRDLPGNNYKDRKEFLADVSSFANTVGGYLIYGIDAKNGIPIELCGVEPVSVDDFKLTCENRLRDGLSPQIPPFNIQSIELKPNTHVIILHIPRSWLIPHRVTLEGHGHFYGRNSGGHFQMDVPQLRSAFELSGTIAEHIRDFRAERLSRISAGEETPAPLNEQEPKIVLHMIPFNAFATSESFDLKPLYDGIKGQQLHPLSVWDDISNGYMRFNADGLVRYIQWKISLSTSTSAYTQVFRNGIIETVDMSLLGINAYNANNSRSNVVPMSFSGERYERKLLECIKRFIGLQEFLGVDQPFFIMVSLLNVKGYSIGYRQLEYTDVIDRNNVIIPEVMIENFDADLAAVMKPIFDTVWNAAGAIGSLNYDAEGKFKFGY